MGEIAIYIRVSTDKQDEGMQISALKSFLKSQNIDYNKCIKYIDKGISGSKIERPDYQKLLSDITKGNIDAIYTYELSRMWRDLEEQSRALKIFETLNIKFTSVKDGAIISLNDELKANLIGAINQHERKRVIQRSADGMKSKAQKTAEIMKRAIDEGWTKEQLKSHEDFWNGRGKDKNKRKNKIK